LLFFFINIMIEFLISHSFPKDVSVVTDLDYFCGTSAQVNPCTISFNNTSADCVFETDFPSVNETPLKHPHSSSYHVDQSPTIFNDECWSHISNSDDHAEENLIGWCNTETQTVASTSRFMLNNDTDGYTYDDLMQTQETQTCPVDATFSGDLTTAATQTTFLDIWFWLWLKECFLLLGAVTVYVT